MKSQWNKKEGGGGVKKRHSIVDKLHPDVSRDTKNS